MCSTHVQLSCSHGAAPDRPRRCGCRAAGAAERVGTVMLQTFRASPRALRRCCALFAPSNQHISHPSLATPHIVGVPQSIRSCMNHVTLCEHAACLRHALRVCLKEQRCVPSHGLSIPATPQPPCTRQRIRAAHSANEVAPQSLSSSRILSCLSQFDEAMHACCFCLVHSPCIYLDPML